MKNHQQLWQWARSFVAVFLATLVLGTTAWADDDDSSDDDETCYSSSVDGIPVPFNPEFENNIGGSAKLCIDDSGLQGKMRVNNATEGNAYTVWWVYINDPVCPGGGFFGCVWTFFGDEPSDFLEFSPELCGVAIPCVDEEPLAVFGRMDSAVGKGSGKLRFSNKLNDMRVSSGSQVWMLMFGHGEAADGGTQLARQLLTPEDPASGFPHVGVNPFGYPAGVAIFEIP